MNRKKIYNELMIRGISLERCPMIIEAIYSCAIQGIKVPKTKEEWDMLVDSLNANKKKIKLKVMN